MSEPKDGTIKVPAEPGTIRLFDTSVRDRTGEDGMRRYRLPDGIVTLVANTQPISGGSGEQAQVTRYEFRGRHGKIDQQKGDTIIADEVFPSVTLATVIAGDSVTDYFFEGESRKGEDRFRDLDERHKLLPATEAQVQSILKRIELATEDNEINIYDRTRAEQESDRRTALEIRELINQGFQIPGANITPAEDGSKTARFGKGGNYIFLSRYPAGEISVQIVNPKSSYPDSVDPTTTVIPARSFDLHPPEHEDQILHYRLFKDKRKADGTLVGDPAREQQVFDIPIETDVQELKDLLVLTPEDIS